MPAAITEAVKCAIIERIKIAETTNLLESLTPNALYAAVAEATGTTLEEIKSDQDLKIGIKSYACQVLGQKDTSAPGNEGSPKLKGEKYSADDVKEKLNCESRKSVKKRPATTSEAKGSKKARAVSSSSNSIKIAKLVKLYKLSRFAFQGLDRSSTTFSDDLKRRLISLLKERKIIEDDKLPTLAQAEAWRRKADLEEELKSIDVDASVSAAKGLRRLRGKTITLPVTEQASSSSPSGSTGNAHSSTSEVESDRQKNIVTDEANRSGSDS